MNEILKLLETRNLYKHLLLFKIYLETKGRTDIPIGGNLRREVRDLFGEEFKDENYRIAMQYLKSVSDLSSSIRYLSITRTFESSHSAYD